jgi:voltage-gated sodium channel
MVLKKTNKFIISEKLLLQLILLNVALIYLHSFDFFVQYFFVFDLLDVLFTLFFTFEITYNISNSSGNSFLEKFLVFHSDKWNKIDFYSILLSLPSIGVLFVDDLEVFAGFTILRSLRILKILRVIEFIPEGKSISSKMLKALKGVSFIIVAFVIYSTIISLISVTLFKSSAPSYFNNAFDSFFTIFKVFSGDGFSDVVAEISLNSSWIFSYFTKFYFVFIVFIGSILGLSLINSVFIDQMSSLDEKSLKDLKSLENKIDILLANQKDMASEIKSLKEKIKIDK